MSKRASSSELTPHQLSKMAKFQRRPTSSNPIDKILEQLNNIHIPADIDDHKDVPEWARTLIKSMAVLVQTVGAVFVHQQQHPTIDGAQEERRQRSLVLSGLPESEKKSGMARARDDMEAVYSALDQCGAEQLPITVFRLGDAEPHKKRLLKIEMPTRSAAAQILKNAKTLKQQGLHFRESMTRAQLTTRSDLIRQCKQRRADAADLGKTGDDADYIIYADAVVLRSEIPKIRQK